MTTITMSVIEASQSKAAFIEWIRHIELDTISRGIIPWLDKFFTDEMAAAFPKKFYNGSWDDRQHILPSGEILPSLIDDIEECISAFTH